MEKSSTPAWLVKIQNKSWEPEILISGITLTSLFFLSPHIYNLFGTLVQAYGVWHTVARIMYIISIGILTGLKLILIVHLLLRGFWTGMVGLSYVFPHGVNRTKLPKSSQNVIHGKPADFVIKTERICSLLFSFIFSSITYTIGIFAVLIPIIFLFLAGLNPALIRKISLFVLLPLILFLVVVLIIYDGKKKKGKSQKPMPVLFVVDTILSIYYTNIGRLKTNAVFVVYFLMIILISWGEFRSFDFDNSEKESRPPITGTFHIDKDHYENLRSHSLRIPRATLDRFQVEGSSLRLFVSYYKQDKFTVDTLKANPDLLRESAVQTNKETLDLPDLYQVYIDHTPTPYLQWFSASSFSTGQKGLTTTIPIGHLSPGHHQLRIAKVLWIIKEKEVKTVSDWASIPFLVER